MKCVRIQSKGAESKDRLQAAMVFHTESHYMFQTGAFESDPEPRTERREVFVHYGENYGKHEWKAESTACEEVANRHQLGIDYTKRPWYKAAGQVPVETFDTKAFDKWKETGPDYCVCTCGPGSESVFNCTCAID